MANSLDFDGSPSKGNLEETYQVISACDYSNSLKVQTLRNEFVNFYRETPIYNLQEQLGGNDPVALGSDEEEKCQKIDEHDNDSEEDENEDRIKMEIKLLRKLPFVRDVDD